MKNVLIGIQARSNSTRLPKKIYQKIGDKTVLEMCYHACRAVKLYPKLLDINTYILGVQSDTELLHYCQENELPQLLVNCDENDLLERYTLAAETKRADFIVRVTSDCPFIPTALIERCVEGLLTDDYVSNTVTRTFPDGFDVQGCSIKAWGWFYDKQRDEREHPFRDFDRNECERNAFEKTGFTWREILNRDNVIFDKRSIDTEDDLVRARRTIAR